MANNLNKAVDERANPRAKAQAAPGSDLDGNALFEALVCELHWTALQVGGIAQVFSAAVRPGQSWMLRSCRNLLPVESPVLKLALESWSDIALPHRLAQFIATFILNLSETKEATERLIEQVGNINSNVPAVAAQILVQHASAWRKLCDDAQKIVQELEPETRFRLGTRFSENALCLGRHLRDGAAGRHEHVDATGNVVLPILPQRRREPRYALLQPCRLIIRQQAWPAFARDVSRNGMGITLKMNLRLGEQVTVQLRSGRSFNGRIVWSNADNHGVYFNDPIAATDPLIAS